ncbi:MAG TPA: DNA polymerase [Candidatus Pacearchaeota archaeon]|nr:DNA polymerase [Candidatus Pacearchaeota archaeon]HOS12863.1 DNA polymerase [Candidatus Pacearchaeota archaeon]
MEYTLGMQVPSKSKKNSLIKDFFIYQKIKDNSPFEIIVALDNEYPQALLNSFQIFLEKEFPLNTIKIILAVKSKPPRQATSRFYKEEAYDFSSYLPKNNKYFIISVGMAICTVSRSVQLSVSDFYDFVFNKTYFYAPYYKTYCFPIDNLYALFKKNEVWVPKDAFRLHFTRLQCKTLRDNADTLWEDTLSSPRYKINIIDSKADFIKIMQLYGDYTGITALDIETSSLLWHSGKIGCFSFAFSRNVVYFVPSIDLIDKKDFETFFSNKKIIGHNFKFDYKFLTNAGYKVPLPYDDTLHLGQTLNEMRNNKLKALAFMYTKFGGYDDALDDYKQKHKINSYLEIPMPVMISYAGMDSLVTFIIYEEMMKQVDELDKKFPPLEEGGWTIKEFHRNFLIPYYQEFCTIDTNGLFIDINKLHELNKTISSDIKETEEKIRKSFNLSPSFNLGSPVQVSKLLEEAGWESLGKNKQNLYLTGDDQLVRWGHLGHKEASYFRRLRTLYTLQKMFLGKKGWENYIVEQNNTYRICPTFGVGYTKSKRNTCKSPNLQQIPARGLYESEIKSLFIPPDPNYRFATLDYNSLQIRLCTLDSMDVFLSNLYKNEPLADLHSITGYTLIKNQELIFYKLTFDNGNEEELYSEAEVIVTNKNNKKVIVTSLEINDFIENKGKIISIEKVERKLKDVKEFIKNKEYGYIAFIRQTAKGANFSLLFGATFSTFSKRVLELIWTDADAEKFVELNKLHKIKEQLLEKAREKNKLDSVMPKINFLTSAYYVRDIFFKQYRGLQDRIERNINFAKENGYVRTVHGVIRRVPMLLLEGKDDDYGEIKNYQNITANSPIQSLEIVKIGTATIEFQKWLRENNKKTKIFNTVHDSIDFYIYLPEAKEVIPKIFETFASDKDWQKGIPLPIDMIVGEKYKKGEKVSTFLEKLSKKR